MTISRRKFLTTASSAALTFATPSMLQAAAPPPRSAVIAASQPKVPTPHPTLIGSSIEPGMFKNLARSLRSLQSAAGYAYPAILDENGYPTATPLYNIYGIIQFPSNFPANTTMVLKWNGTATIQLARGAPGFSVVSGTTYVAGAASFNLTAAGTNARVVFTFAGAAPSQLTLNFLAGGKFSNLSNLVLCKLSDEAAVDQATTPEQMFDDGYIAIYQALSVGTVRPMGWTNPNSGNVSQARYLAPWSTAINLITQRWAPGAWAGTTTGTNAYVCGAQKDATRAYVDGEMIQLQFASANTSRTVTLNSGGRGTKPLLVGAGGTVAQPLTIGQIQANSLATLTYDAILDAFMWQTGGQTTCLPYELQVAFANRIGANYWCNFSAYFDNTSVSAVVQVVRDRLSANLNAYFEYGNEIWNWGFPATPWADAKGAALGLPSDNNRRNYGWYALRTRQIMELVASAWSPRSLGQLRRVMAFQAFGPTGATNTYRFQGTDLNGGLYRQYAAKGYPNYNAAPNRPIDFCEVLSYATYYSGAQCTNFDANYLSNGAAAIADLLAAADNYASGVPSKMASALSFIESDIRAGTLSGSGKKGSQTLLALNSGTSGTGIYQAWEVLASLYSKPVEAYEGGHESWYPSTQTCTTLGISTAYGGQGGKISNLIDAFKFSDAFKVLVQDQMTQFLSQSHSRATAWLIVPGYNQWALSSGDSFASKYKSWDAVAGLT